MIRFVDIEGNEVEGVEVHAQWVKQFHFRKKGFCRTTNEVYVDSPSEEINLTVIMYKEIDEE